MAKWKDVSSIILIRLIAILLVYVVLKKAILFSNI